MGIDNACTIHFRLHRTGGERSKGQTWLARNETGRFLVCSRRIVIDYWIAMPELAVGSSSQVTTWTVALPAIHTRRR